MSCAPTYRCERLQQQVISCIARDQQQSPVELEGKARREHQDGLRWQFDLSEDDQRRPVFQLFLRRHLVSVSRGSLKVRPQPLISGHTS
jgi:hypothetical protein